MIFKNNSKNNILKKLLQLSAICMAIVAFQSCKVKVHVKDPVPPRVYNPYYTYYTQYFNSVIFNIYDCAPSSSITCQVNGNVDSIYSGSFPAISNSPVSGYCNADATLIMNVQITNCGYYNGDQFIGSISCYDSYYQNYLPTSQDTNLNFYCNRY